MGAVQKLSSGRELYIETHGENSALRTLLCIHGLGGGAYFFTALGQALKARVKTIAFDLPGHGFSPRDAQGFCFERTTDLVVELLRQSSGPVTLLGHSLGTIVALKAYAHAPELFRNLLFVGGVPEALPEAKTRLLERAAFLRSRGTMVGLGEAILPFLIAPQALQTMPGMLGPMYRLVESNHALAYAETCEALAATSAVNVVTSVQVPCRVVTGSADLYAPPAAAKGFASELAHASFIEIPQCGHFPFMEKPAEFLKAVKDFVEN